MSKSKKAQQIMLAGFGVIILLGGVLAWVWNRLPPQIPWFYSMPWGEQQLGNKLLLVFALAAMGIQLVLSRMIGIWAGKKDETVEITIMAGGLIVTILMGAGLLRVIQIISLL